MSDDESTFLQGDELSSQIRKICSGKKVRCAVAFWGKGMAGSLFPNPKKQDIRIICDISMGATSRSALKELGAPENSDLKVCDGLHGKVYLSEFGAVIGSSNASDNGIGRISGQGGKLLEAGVFCSTESAAYTGASKWFDKVFEASGSVDEKKLSEAQEFSRELRLQGDWDKMKRLPLLTRLRDYPQNFKDAWVAIANKPLNKSQAADTRKQRDNEIPAGAAAVKDEVILQDEDGCELRSFGDAPILFFWKESRTIGVYGNVHCSTWPPAPRKPDTVFGIENWKAFWNTISEPPSAKKFTEQESELIGELFTETRTRWLFTADEFSEELKRFSS